MLNSLLTCVCSLNKIVLCFATVEGEDVQTTFICQIPRPNSEHSNQREGAVYHMIAHSSKTSPVALRFSRCFPCQGTGTRAAATGLAAHGHGPRGGAQGIPEPGAERVAVQAEIVLPCWDRDFRMRKSRRHRGIRFLFPFPLISATDINEIGHVLHV